MAKKNKTGEILSYGIAAVVLALLIVNTGSSEYSPRLDKELQQEIFETSISSLDEEGDSVTKKACDRDTQNYWGKTYSYHVTSKEECDAGPIDCEDPTIDCHQDYR